MKLGTRYRVWKSRHWPYAHKWRCGRIDSDSHGPYVRDIYTFASWELAYRFAYTNTTKGELDP